MNVENLFETTEITPFTLAVIPHQAKGGELYSKILEDDQVFIVKQKPTEVIHKACEFYGMTLDGIQAATRKLINIKHKIPICIEARSGMYFFPSSSPNNDDCHWLAHSHILSLQPAETFKTKVYFHNGQSILVDISYNSLEGQLLRTAQYRTLLDRRIEMTLENFQRFNPFYPSSFERPHASYGYVAEHPRQE